MTIVHDDDDIVVVDKPVGVAAHPSVGWTGPDVVGRPRRGGLPHLDLRRERAAGRRQPARRRHVRPHGRRQERARLLRLKRAFKQPHGRQDVPRAGPGAARPARRHHRRPDRAAPGPRLQVRGHGERQAVRDPLRGRRGVPARVACSRSTSRPGRTHQIRVHFAALHHPCCGDLDLRRRPQARRAARARPPVAARRPASGSSTPARESTSPSRARTPRTCSARSTSSRRSDLHPQREGEGRERPPGVCRGPRPGAGRVSSGRGGRSRRP